MAPKALDFQCAIVTGGAGGIGKAMAEWLLSLGKKVIIVGRTESKLKEAVKDLGHGTTYYVLDTGDLKAIPSFAERVVKDNPEVDCLINNAGIQYPLSVNSFDLSKADQEIQINIQGPIHLAIALLPQLKSRPTGVIVNVSSVLGFVPYLTIAPVYCATKAFIHSWSMSLRTQLEGSNPNVKVVEVAPPMVGTDLHRGHSDPDNNKKEKNPIALTIQEFIDAVSKGFQKGDDVITAGPGVEVVGKWYDDFGAVYEQRAIK